MSDARFKEARKARDDDLNESARGQQPAHPASHKDFSPQHATQVTLPVANTHVNPRDRGDGAPPERANLPQGQSTAPPFDTIMSARGN